MYARNARTQRKASMSGTRTAHGRNDFDLAHCRSGSAGKQPRDEEAVNRKSGDNGCVASETESAHTLEENEVTGLALAMMKGTPRNSEALPSSSGEANSAMQNEGGQQEGQDQGPNSLLAMSL